MREIEKESSYWLKQNMRNLGVIPKSFNLELHLMRRTSFLKIGEGLKSLNSLDNQNTEN